MRQYTLLVMLCLAPASSAAEREVELLDAGHGAKHKLRYQCPESGGAFQVIWQDTATIIRGVMISEERAQPTYALIWDYQAKRSGDACDLELSLRESRIADDQRTKKTATRYAPVLERLRGVTLAARATPDGRLSSIQSPSVDGEAAMILAKVFELLRNELFVPLPERAVAVGAKWRASFVYPFSLPGAPVNGVRMTKLYTLLSADERGFRVSYDVLASAPDQKMAKVNPRDEAVFMEKFHGAGGGAANFQYGRVGPVLVDQEYLLELDLVSFAGASDDQAERRWRAQARNDDQEAKVGNRVALRTREQISAPGVNP